VKKPELLAPAGNLEKLKIAVIYGADAVYLGGENFGLRAGAKNFTLEQLTEGIKFAHDRGRRIYLTLNIIPHNEDLVGLPEYVTKLKELGLDAIIISDPGVLKIVKNIIPEMEVHLSTQASTTNYAAVNFWYEQGIRRIILARELSLKEIKEIIKKSPPDMKMETFVHGAMCISYSGRCLLSNYMVSRDANRGDCAHSCRWRYYLMEETRPGEYRMKSSYYVATVVKAYRHLIDSYFSKQKEYFDAEKWLDEIKKVSHRYFTTGFYFAKPGGEEQRYDSSAYIKTYDYAGLILSYNASNQIATIEQKNRIFAGDEIEIFGPDDDFFTQKIEKMWDEDGEEIEVAPHAKQIIRIKMSKPVKPWYIIRKFNEN